jgi:multimeric flavodoxin WrbA
MMSKKILVISASPRKGGNSDTLCDEFIRGARDAGSDAEKVFLRDKKINYCMGCEACTSNGGKCVQKDDAPEIIDKMAASDVIVFATPVYFYSMAAQMKALIDRSVGRYTEISNKGVYFIITAADSSKENMQPTISALRGYTEMCLDGTSEKNIIYGTGVWKKGEINNKPAMKEAYEAGKNA